MKSQAKLILIGLDAATLPMVNQLIKEGKLPQIAKLKKAGAAMETIPSTPADTPTNWSTIVTGANVETHGVTSFTGHIAGEDFRKGEKEGMRNKSSSFLKAEPIWNTAEEEGLRSLVLNYPVGWPSTLEDGLVIGGACPGADQWRIGQPAIYASSTPEKAMLSLESLNPEVGWKKVALTKDKDPNKNHNSQLPPIEIPLPLGNEASIIFRAISKNGEDYDAVSYPGTRGNQKTIQEGEWTEWLNMEIDETSCVFKLKLVRLDKSGKEVEIYRTDIFQTSGWGSVGGIEAKINKAVGPYIESLECPHISTDPVRRPYGPINVNMETVLELAGMQADWFANTISFLQKEVKWDLLFSHYHLIDSLGHTFPAILKESSPWHSKKDAEKVWKIYAESFEIIDKMIGRIIDKNANKDSLIGVISDHGTLPTWRMVDIPRLLEKAGFLHYKDSIEGDKLEIDLESSKAVPYIDPQYIWINLKGREKNGAVEPSDYENLRAEIIQTLREVKDPKNGNNVFSLVTRKEDLGLSGAAEERIGDIVFFLAPGYSTWDGTIDSLRSGYKYPEGKDTVRSSQYVLGHHTPFLPSEESGLFSNRGMLILKGPGVKSGVEPIRSPDLKDVAPTISKLLGISEPKENDGSIIEEITK